MLNTFILDPDESVVPVKFARTSQSSFKDNNDPNSHNFSTPETNIPLSNCAPVEGNFENDSFHIDPEQQPLSPSLSKKTKNYYGDLESTILNSQSHAEITTSQSASTNAVDINNSVVEVELASSGTRKRTIDEIFGDIDDILFEDQVGAKKHKSDKAADDLALIEHIIRLRKLSKERNNPLIGSRNYETSCIDRDKRNISYRVPNYPFIGVTSPDGERIYVRCHSEQYEKEERERIMTDLSFNGVLEDHFKEIWKEAGQLVSDCSDRFNSFTVDARVSIPEKIMEPGTRM